MTVEGGPTQVIEGVLRRQFGLHESAAHRVALEIRADLDRADYIIGTRLPDVVLASESPDTVRASVAKQASIAPGGPVYDSTDRRIG
jgi:hypothetical protein